MILIIGGAYQGKFAFAQKFYPWIHWIDGRDCDKDAVCQCRGIHHFHSYIERMMRENMDVGALAADLYERNPEAVIVSDEIGYGIVPADPFERAYRETAGRICTELAARADKVYRVVCGIGVLIKDEKRRGLPEKDASLHVYLIRHSITEGNRKKRYIGVTDEELCEEGIELLSGRKYPAVQRVYASPMRRCLKTAELIYPGKMVTVVPELAECDFGLFENKNYQELADCREYQEWVDSGGTLPFPGGESKEGFSLRSLKGFGQVVQECRKLGITSAALVVHGGTIMSVMERYAYPRGNYYDYHVENGEGYELIVTERMVDGMPGQSEDTACNCNASGGSRIPAGSGSGGSGVAVSSGPADRTSDYRDGTNYQKLSAEE